MPLDGYSPCPGGTGKKIKFCCQDLLPELDKIERMLAGQQRLACLEHVERVDAKYPHRACLLSTKLQLQQELQQTEAAAATLAELRQCFPDNPVTIAELGDQAVREGRFTEGARLVHQALARCEHDLPPQVLESLMVLGAALAMIGETLSARSQFELVLSIDPENTEAAQYYSRILMGATNLWARTPLTPSPTPDKVPWRGKFQEARDALLAGKWIEAEERFAALRKLAPHDPAVLRNLAIAHTFLADNDAAVAAWRALASLPVGPELSLDQAVEAEVLAQILDRHASTGDLDQVQVVYEIADFENLLARLASDHRLLNLHADRLPRGDDDAPPPRVGYLIWDRQPIDDVAAPIEQLPRGIGQFLVYGKQTDQPARLELVAARGTDLDTASDILRQIAGDALGQSIREEVLSHLPAFRVAVAQPLRVPQGTPPERVREITHQHRQNLVLQRWAELPEPVLQGRIPRDAAADSAARIPLLARILILEGEVEFDRADIDLDPLRKSLGLPVLGGVDPWQGSVENLSLVRLARVQVEKLEDQPLLVALNRAIRTRAMRAVRRLAAEALQRPSLDKTVDKASLYLTLGTLEDDHAVALQHIRRGRELVAPGQSVAPFALEELSLYLETGNAPEFGRLLQEISTRHINEPGVRVRLTQILMAAGLIGPDGRPTIPTGAGPAAAPAAEAGKLWTPDAELPPAAPAEASAKPSLWLPGMG